MRKLNKNKKGIMFFTLIIALAAVSILTLVLINYASRPAQSLEESMGIKQYGIIQNTLSSMEITFNLKQVSKYALEGTLKKSFKTLKLSENSPCQKYCNVQMINTETEFCKPDYESSLAENMNLIIDSRTNGLENTYDVEIPENNYILSIFNNSISFIAKESVQHTSNNLNYSFLPSFEIKSEQEIIETNILLEKVIQLNQTCKNQPLSCIQTWLNENSEFTVMHGLYSTDCTNLDPENLKYHIFNYDNNLADTDFAIFIDSDILNSGEQEELIVQQGTNHTFQDSNGEEHTLTITSLLANQIEGTIESEPTPFLLKLGNTSLYDITQDNTYDIYISFEESISETEAKLIFMVFDKPPELGYLIEEYLPFIDTGSEDNYENSMDGSLMQIAANIIKAFEGIPNNGCTYICPAGYPTIGYGHLLVPGDGFDDDSCLTEEEAVDLLAEEIGTEYYPQMVNALDNRGLDKDDFNKYQLAAMTSYVYNLGWGVINTYSWVDDYKNGDLVSVETKWKLSDKAGGCPLAGLARRRFSEWELFSTGLWSEQPEGWQEYYNGRKAQYPECS